nr:reverse transcriptase domain-containing protein [Tanacetum cinerariifolium]
MATDRNGDPPVPDLRTMKELCQPTLNGRGGPIAPIAIQATNFRLKNDMIQQVQNSCQFHGLPDDDANKHLDKFLHVTQSIKVNRVTDDALYLYLFPHSLTHHATGWFDRLPRNSINTFEQMAKMFLEKYFPPSMVTKLRNEITNFRQPLKAETTEINKNLMKVLQINQQVKAVAHNCKTCGGLHSYNDCLTAIGQSQNVYVAGAYNQGDLPNQNRNQENNHGIPQGNNQRRNQFFQGASHGQNPPPAYQALAYQALGYQALVHQPPIPQPQVMTTIEFTNYMKANDAILKNMQTNMTSLSNYILELKNMFGQFMKMNTASSLGSRTLPSNTITNPKEDLKVERETEVTKDTVHPTNNGSTKDVQPLLVQIKTLISNSEPVVTLVSEPVVALVSASKPNPKPSILYPKRILKKKTESEPKQDKIRQETESVEKPKSTKMYINTPSWDRPTICYNDDDDKDCTISITPILSTEGLDNSLSMGDEHLDTIPAKESDEVIKSSVENLVPIPSESEGIPDNMCDVPFHDNSPPLDISKDQIEDFFESNEDSTSIDDDSFSIDDIEYVEASPPDFELISLEVMEIVILEVGGIDTDILLTIKDDILREKLLNINILIANIEALKDNPTPSFDFVAKSSSTSLNFLLEESNTFDNSLPESETFCFDSKENSSGSTTTRSDISLPDYEAFYDDHVK